MHRPEDGAPARRRRRGPSRLLPPHAQGAHRALEPGEATGPRKGESSWEYFARVYGSITWILDGNADQGLGMFYCGNVTGGGWSCLEIDGDGTYDMDGLIDATGNTEVEDLFVFHGGWHTGRAFAFDQRVASRGGEHAIVPFDENIGRLPRPRKPESIEPFGLWLHKRVEQLTKLAERNLREVS